MKQIKQQKSKSKRQNSKMKLLNLSYCFFISRAIHVAAELGIADILDKPLTAAEIAKQLNTDPESTERLVRFLSLYSIFSIDKKHRYYNNTLSKYLRSDSPESMRAMLMIEDNSRWNSYGELLYSIKTGKPSFFKIYGESIPNYIAARPELSERYVKGMQNWTKEEEEVLAKAYDYKKFAVIADIGGGSGGLLTLILQNNPKSRGILFDMANVVNQANLPIHKIPAARREIIADDFFSAVPKGADLYILKRIIHDWNDEKCIKILKNIHAVLPEKGRVLIMESVLDPQTLNRLVYDVDLMVMCLLGGKERTKEEFEKISKASDFKINGIIPTKSVLSIIELAKA